MTQAIEVSTPTPISSTTSGGWTREQLDLLKETLAKDLTDNEFKLFSFICQKTNLDPFGRQIYAVKRGGRMVIQTGIDGFRIIAGRTGEHGGTSDIEYDSDDGPNPKWAKVTVTRLVAGKERFFSCTARWNEFAVLGHDGKPNTFWRKMPFHMLGKVAESHALRKAFPNELSGLYTSDEMGQADNPVQAQPQIQKPQPKRVKPKAKPRQPKPRQPKQVKLKDHLTEGMFEAEMEPYQEDIDEESESAEESFSEPEHLADVREIAPVALESGGDFVDQQDGFVTVQITGFNPKPFETNRGSRWGAKADDVATGAELGWINTYSRTCAEAMSSAKNGDPIQVKFRKDSEGNLIEPLLVDQIFGAESDE